MLLKNKKTLTIVPSTDKKIITSDGPVEPLAVEKH